MPTIYRSICRPRIAFAVAASIAAVAVIPASAFAATTSFGSSLNHDPANAGSSCADNGLTGPTVCTHVGSFYPGTSGRAAAPVSGTITKIRLRAQGPSTMTFKVVQVRKVSADHKHGQARAIVKSRVINVQGPSQSDLDNGIYPVESFKVHLRVQKGQELAVDTASNTAEYCADGTPGQLLFDPTPAVGNGFRSAGGFDGCLMEIQGVISH
ncbi:MAG: hypothetical protein WBP81_32410 [Solirubrobacteraceae bacterium]